MQNSILVFLVLNRLSLLEIKGFSFKEHKGIKGNHYVIRSN